MSANRVPGSVSRWQHARCSRRAALQVGAIGILGLGTNHLAGLRQTHASDGRSPSGKAKSCIFIFLSGGLSQHDSFDMKPNAPDKVVGKSDAKGAYPDEHPVKPENFAATIYDALGIPATAAWHDAENRPHHIYQGEPIAGLC